MFCGLFANVEHGSTIFSPDCRVQVEALLTVTVTSYITLQQLSSCPWSSARFLVFLVHSCQVCCLVFGVTEWFCLVYLLLKFSLLLKDFPGHRHLVDHFKNHRMYFPKCYVPPDQVCDTQGQGALPSAHDSVFIAETVSGIPDKWTLVQ